MKAKWWKVLLAMVICPVAMYLISQSIEKRYTASMRLLVDTSFRSTDFPTPFSAIDDTTGFTRSRSAQSQLDVITGSNVLIDAIQRTARQHPKAFSGAAIGDQYADLVKRISFDTSQFSDVITLRVTMSDPRIAADTANNIGLAYIDFNQKMAEESGAAAIRQIKAQIEPLKTRLEEMDEEVAKKRAESGVPEPTAMVAAETNTYANTKQALAGLEASYEGVKAELSSAEASLTRMEETVTASKSQVLNPNMQQLDLDLTRLEAERESLLARYLPEAEPVRALDARIKQIKDERAKLSSEIEAGNTTAPNPNRTQQEFLVTSLKARRDSMQRQIAELRGAVNQMEQRTQKFADVDKDLRAIERTRIALEGNYQALMQRLDILESTGKGRQSNARIVSTAIPPLNAPSFPDTRLFIFFGLGLGVVISAFILMPKGEVDVYGEVKPTRTGVGGRRGQAVGSRNLPTKPRNGESGGSATTDQGGPPETPPPAG